MERADYLNLFEIPLLSISLNSLHRSAGLWCEPEPPPQTAPAALQVPDCPSDKSREKLFTKEALKEDSLPHMLGRLTSRSDKDPPL